VNMIPLSFTGQNPLWIIPTLILIILYAVFKRDEE
jgi:hypothetical protein